MLFIAFCLLPWKMTTFPTIVTFNVKPPPSLILATPPSMHQFDSCGDCYRHFLLTQPFPNNNIFHCLAQSSCKLLPTNLLHIFLHASHRSAFTRVLHHLFHHFKTLQHLSLRNNPFFTALFFALHFPIHCFIPLFRTSIFLLHSALFLLLRIQLQNLVFYFYKFGLSLHAVSLSTTLEICTPSSMILRSSQQEGRLYKASTCSHLPGLGIVHHSA